MGMANRITAAERDRIEGLLRTVPIFEAQRISRRPLGTLIKIAKVHMISESPDEIYARLDAASRERSLTEAESALLEQAIKRINRRPSWERRPWEAAR